MDLETGDYPGLAVGPLERDAGGAQPGSAGGPWQLGQQGHRSHLQKQPCHRPAVSPVRPNSGVQDCKGTFVLFRATTLTASTRN